MSELNFTCTPVFARMMKAHDSGKFKVYVFEGGSRSSKTYSLIQFFIRILVIQQCRQVNHPVSVVIVLATVAQIQYMRLQKVFDFSRTVATVGEFEHGSCRCSMGCRHGCSGQ